MESVAAARVNATLEKMRRNMAAVEGRSEEFGRATFESGRRMESWAQEVIDTDRNHQSLYITGLSELEEARAKEQERERIARETIDTNSQEAENLRQEGLGLQDEVEDLSLTRSAIPKEKSELKASLQVEEKKYAERKAHVSQAHSRLKARMHTLRKEIDTYQNLLGLRLEAYEDRSIRFRFQCIDRNDEDAEHTVSVSTKENQFKGTQCEPMVPEFERLNNKLMNDAKLVPFLRDMRCAFVRMANRRGVRAPSLEIE